MKPSMKRRFTLLEGRNAGQNAIRVIYTKIVNPDGTRDESSRLFCSDGRIFERASDETYEEFEDRADAEAKRHKGARRWRRIHSPSSKIVPRRLNDEADENEQTDETSHSKIGSHTRAIREWAWRTKSLDALPLALYLRVISAGNEMISKSCGNSLAPRAAGLYQGAADAKTGQDRVS